MSKIGLIFTAATGGGHNQAAQSLKQQLSDHMLEFYVVEPFKENSKFLETMIEDGYTFLANYTPKLYGEIYRISGHKTTNRQLKRIFKLMLKNKILSYINQYHPSIIISTHPLFVHIIAELKREGLTKAVCLSVVTDLGVHRFYAHDAIDAYITGSKITNHQLQALGISQDKIFDYGIPVKPEFYALGQTSRTDFSPFTILLMGGSMGSRKLYKTLAFLMKVKQDILIQVVCGNNKTIKNNIESHFQNLPDNISLEVYGFISNVHELMDQADILISKPGGLTLTEAINKSLPMIIPFYIHGQEAENTEILAQEGLGIYVKHLDQLPEIIESFVNEPERLRDIKNKMKAMSSNYSVEKISDLCHELMA